MKISKLIKRNAHKIPIPFYRALNLGIRLKNLVSKNYKLSNNFNSPNFFIIGSGRSGNTLLRAILTTHPKIAIPPESYVLHSVYKKFYLNRNLSWEDFAKIIIAEFESHPKFHYWNISMVPVYKKVMKLPKRYRTLANIINEIYLGYAVKNFPGATIWGDKTPMNALYANWISKIFPNASYIHILRDGRDVVSSYLKAGLYDNLEDACWRWRESVNMTRGLRSNLSSHKYIEIRYEDLVKNTETIIKKVCKFLSIKFHEDMLHHEKKISNLSDEIALKHLSNLSKPVNTSSIGKWKRDLSQEQKKIVNELIRETLKMCDYI